MNTTAVWAHRGWRSRHPDNTAQAIGAAFGVVDVVEIDIRRSADGRLLLSHDPDLRGLVVAETPWSVLRELDLGGGQRPLLFEELLTMFPDRRFDIEVKNSPFDPGFEADGAIVEDVLKIARPTDVVTSFHWPSLDMHAGLAEERGVATGLLLDLDVPLRDTLAHAGEHGHTSIAPSLERLDAWGAEGAVAAVHDAGLDLVVWTVNESSDAIRLAEIGIDAIITDDPGLLVDSLARPETSNRRYE
jgi:glycerophosphoryl diester phosphodiesterase